MPNVCFDKILLGQECSRPLLAELWGYKDWHALGRGIFTPKETNKIILFVTKEKQKELVQYKDYFEDGLLHIEGEKSHASDERLIKSQEINNEIHLFYREKHHSNFIYMGRIHLVSYKEYMDRPSYFIFSTSKSDVSKCF